MIAFAFLDNLSAENSKLSTDSGSQRSQLLECMFMLDLTVFLQGSDWYIEQMPSVMEGQVCMEKTPGYFHEAPVRFILLLN